MSTVQADGISVMGKKQIENPPQNPEAVMWALQLCLNVGWTTVMEYVSHQRSQYYFRSLIAGMQLLKLGLMSFIYNSSDSVSNPFSKIGLFLNFLMHGSSNSRKKTTYSIFFIWIGFFRQQLFQTMCLFSPLLSGPNYPFYLTVVCFGFCARKASFSSAEISKTYLQ